jgi:hypothetical protein
MDAFDRHVFDRLEPVADSYATLPVGQAFTWAPVAAELPPGEWYMVAFRSILRADADCDRLTSYDDWAHAEAEGAPGFVHYHKGPLAPDNSCLSFCMWNSRAEARAAAARPNHQNAVTLIAETYEAYTLEFLRVSKPAGETSLAFEPYDKPAETEAAPATEPRPALGFRPATS